MKGLNYVENTAFSSFQRKKTKHMYQKFNFCRLETHQDFALSKQNQWSFWSMNIIHCIDLCAVHRRLVMKICCCCYCWVFQSTVVQSIFTQQADTTPRKHLLVQITDFFFKSQGSIVEKDTGKVFWEIFWTVPLALPAVFFRDGMNSNKKALKYWLDIFVDCPDSTWEQ